ncbi:hypothetical protein CDAR_195221 [Caerostris darwini]|uniref:Uncharacterized protein n=1 Tax=Caerostris darwini TaxID=1538125 RepID=A0AAV4R0H3_9ARAC|nr:hypothetical protein CDAR_195221 [Caerostris darwini]
MTFKLKRSQVDDRRREWLCGSRRLRPLDVFWPVGHSGAKTQRRTGSKGDGGPALEWKGEDCLHAKETPQLSDFSQRIWLYKT